MSREGIITKGVGSFYYVMTKDGSVYECRVRGIFRKRNVTPTVGDRVLFEENEKQENLIIEILQRESYLMRPMVANATIGVVVASIKEPDLSTFLLDKMLVSQQIAGLPILLVLNKIDLTQPEQIDELLNIYAHSGVTIILTDAEHGVGLESLKKEIHGHISVFSGVSGAGKSTIIGKLTGKDLETGKLSKFNRGKHTTRHSELIVVDHETFIMDTPGFSELRLDISPEELWEYYPDFYEYSDCRFSSCIHVNEPGCNVKKAVEEGNISKIRYENYLLIYQELKKNYQTY